MTATASPTGETILCVEGGPPVRRHIRRMLQGQGYQVLEASSGQEALGLAADHRGPIELLVTDAVMPHMSGFTLGERLVRVAPGDPGAVPVGLYGSVGDRGAPSDWTGHFCSGRSPTTACSGPFAISWTPRREASPAAIDGRRTGVARGRIVARVGEECRTYLSRSIAARATSGAPGPSGAPASTGEPSGFRPLCGPQRELCTRSDRR